MRKAGKIPDRMTPLRHFSGADEAELVGVGRDGKAFIDGLLCYSATAIL